VKIIISAQEKEDTVTRLQVAWKKHRINKDARIKMKNLKMQEHLMDLAIKEQDDRSMSSRGQDRNPILPERLYEFTQIVEKGCFTSGSYHFYYKFHCS
jgi:hypothetical protein